MFPAPSISATIAVNIVYVHILANASIGCRANWSDRQLISSNENQHKLYHLTERGDMYIQRSNQHGALKLRKTIGS